MVVFDLDDVLEGGSLIEFVVEADEVANEITDVVEVLLAGGAAVLETDDLLAREIGFE